VLEKVFADSKEKDIIVELEPDKNTSFLGKLFGKTSVIKVRLLKVLLNSGEEEILISSLKDKIQYPLPLFKDLYFKRWGIETLYDKLKIKLKIESFTGYSETSILQDFYCTLFLSNIQSLLISEANETLQE
jgi:IS4 transposase